MPPPPTTKHQSFLHMSDIHVSGYRRYSYENLKNFCNSVFPSLVAKSEEILFLAITGDLTDGIGQIFSFDEWGQQPVDWELISEAISDCRRNTGIPVFHIRGNHDCFGVHSFWDQSNSAYHEMYDDMIRQHGDKVSPLTIHNESGSYAFQIGKSRFIFVENDRIIPGPHQYYGELSDNRAAWLKSYIDGPTNLIAESTFVFSHYPIGTLTPDSRDRTLAALEGSKSRVTYMSGHIHSVCGRNGVQSIRSHGLDVLNELQVSDYKWSGIVRKISLSGIFVDIPTIPGGNASATILYDPTHDSTGALQVSLMTIHAPFRIQSAHACGNKARIFPKMDIIGKTAVFDVSNFSKSDLKCIMVNNIDIFPVDTRLRFGSPIWFLFTYWFEALQILVLVLYIGTVYFAREIYLKTATQGLTRRIIPLYLVLSPLIPNTLSEHLYKREWLVANGVALFDLRTYDVILDTETTRLGFMIFLYFLTAISLNFRLSLRENRITLGSLIWILALAFPSFLDVRFILGRGGLRSLFLSPHTWYMVWYWKQWLNPVMRKKAAMRD